LGIVLVTKILDADFGQNDVFFFFFVFFFLVFFFVVVVFLRYYNI